MQFPAYDQQRCSRNTIDHTERPVHKSSVYEPSSPHCSHRSLKDPAEKAERKEQPQAFKSCISHILYLSSPVFSFCFPGSTASFMHLFPGILSSAFSFPVFYINFFNFPSCFYKKAEHISRYSTTFLFHIEYVSFISFCEPHMTKVTCFSAVLNGKTGYRRIRLKLRTAQICASSMPGTAGFHITGSPPDICLCLCSFRTSILILKDEQISINA